MYLLDLMKWLAAGDNGVGALPRRYGVRDLISEGDGDIKYQRNVWSITQAAIHIQFQLWIRLFQFLWILMGMPNYVWLETASQFPPIRIITGISRVSESWRHFGIVVQGSH